MTNFKKEGSGKNKVFIVLGLLVVVGLISLYALFAEQGKPSLSFAPDKKFITADTKFNFRAEDKSSGLNSVSVSLKQKGEKVEIFKKNFDKIVNQIDKEFELQEYGLRDGQLTISIKARDNSWNNWFKGNLASKQFVYTLDTKPPMITLKSYRHNLQVGGSGLVAFNVSEPVQKIGVKAKDHFFPAYSPPESDMFLCFFSYPYDLSSREGKLLIKAEDRAGNVKKTGFNYYVSGSNFQHSNIRISSRFLQRKMPQFQDVFPDTRDDLDLFLRVNKELREKNRQKLLELGRSTEKTPLWSGDFVRLPNSAKRSYFGTYRKYYHQGEKIDNQRHLGVDLASVKGAEVPAANAGKVVFTGWLGIFGQIVVIDHGLGLQSMYAHLSRIKVQEGDTVEKKQVIANTGATGLAGGDHLHFSVLVSGIPVAPVEWWDDTWIENNIRPKLELLKNATSTS